MRDPFQKAKAVLQMLMNYGYDAYIVGGSVRDFLQDASIHDIDIATSATPDKVTAIFPKTFPVGIQHGTVLVRHENENYEVTTFRSETGYKDFRHPDKVEFETSIYKDLARRDFTMNALAMDVNGVIIDPYNGQKDLTRGCLKTVGNPLERFKEDPLRMLRAVRFVAQFNLKADVELQAAMKRIAPYIKHLAVERIREEFTKLLSGKWLKQGIDLLVTTQMDKHLPSFEMADVMRCENVPFFSLASSTERWALYLVVTGCQSPEKFLKAWRFSNKEHNKITTLISTFLKQRDKYWDKLSLYKSGLETAQSVERMKQASVLNTEGSDVIKKLWESLAVKQRSELAVNGADLCKWLQQSGGPWTGELIEKIEEAVILEQLKNEREDIQRWVRSVD